MRRLVKKTSSSVMILDGRKGETFVISMKSNVNQLVLSNPVSGVVYIFIVKQDSIGGRTLTWGSNLRNGGQIDGRPLAVSVQSFIGDSGGILRANLPGTWGEL